MLWKDITIYYPHWRSGHVRMWFGILEGFVSLPFVYLLNHLIVSYGPWILCTLGCNPTPLYSVVPVVPTLTTLRSSVVSYVSLKCLRYCVSLCVWTLANFFPTTKCSRSILSISYYSSKISHFSKNSSCCKLIWETKHCMHSWLLGVSLISDFYLIGHGEKGTKCVYINLRIFTYL